MTEGGVVCAAGIDQVVAAILRFGSGTQIALATGNLGRAAQVASDSPDSRQDGSGSPCQRSKHSQRAH